MSQINQLSAVSACSAGQQFPIYDPTQGDTRKASLSTLLAWLQGVLTLGRPEPTSQYAAPSATGFTVAITDSNVDIHLMLTPLAGYAGGTITLPKNTNCRDKQEVTVTTTQAVTTLTIGSNGATSVIGAPTTLSAGSFFKLKYDSTVNTWYRVG